MQTSFAVTESREKPPRGATPGPVRPNSQRSATIAAPCASSCAPSSLDCSGGGPRAACEVVVSRRCLRRLGVLQKCGSIGLPVWRRASRWVLRFIGAWHEGVGPPRLPVLWSEHELTIVSSPISPTSSAPCRVARCSMGRNSPFLSPKGFPRRTSIVICAPPWIVGDATPWDLDLDPGRKPPLAPSSLGCSGGGLDRGTGSGHRGVLEIRHKAIEALTVRRLRVARDAGCTPETALPCARRRGRSHVGLAGVARRPAAIRRPDCFPLSRLRTNAFKRVRSKADIRTPYHGCG